jgi:hypothetical protein
MHSTTELKIFIQTGITNNDSFHAWREPLMHFPQATSKLLGNLSLPLNSLILKGSLEPEHRGDIAEYMG